MIGSIIWISSFLIVWFNTEAFVEYVDLFKIPFFKVKEYVAAKQNDCSLTYHTYLLYNYNNFFVRLVTCPICTTAWLSLLSYFFIDIYLIELPIIFLSTLFIYYLFNDISS